jgi:fructuronate reductase
MAVTVARLGRPALAALPGSSAPLIDRPRPGIVHIGLGAFHRAHQAVYTEEAMAATGGDWGIMVVAPRSADLVATINAQDGLFSVTDLDGASAQTRVVASLVGALHLPTQAAEILDLLADPTIRVVTLTVTEKAYLTDPATGRLLDDPALAADLAGAGDPTTVPGLLVRGLRRRAAAGGPPLAIVSCDNLPSNGARLRSALTQALGEEPPAWVSFPGTMVDRIVPATTTDTLARAAAALGVRDDAAVAAEPYREWVIEDEFPAGRPEWDAAGAVFSTDVAGYERLKLRVLNGVHSTTAYLGALAGYETIADTLQMPGMEAFLHGLIVDDVAPTLTPPAGVDVIGYGDTVLHRFANPAIRHRTLQVAMDGSQKLPQRLLGTLADRRASGAEAGGLALAIAGWIRFLGGTADDGRALPLDDPLAVQLRDALAAAGSAPIERVRAIFAADSIFAPELRSDADLVEMVADRLHRLEREGVMATVASASR